MLRGAYKETRIRIDLRSPRIGRVYHSRPVRAIIDMRQHTICGPHLSNFLFAVCCNLAIRYSMLTFFTKCVVLLRIFAINLQPCTSLMLPGESSSLSSVSVNSSIPSSTGLSTNDTVTWNSPKCVGNQDWMGGGIVESDCWILVNRVYSAILPQFERMYNFVAAESHSIAPPNALRLPRKYIYGEWLVFPRCCGYS